MKKLDGIALDIEFLLISVIQGVALASLASAALVPLTTLQFAMWPYIAVAFLFVLIFWSGAIIHAVSFIDWPIDLFHSFLYFLASMVEILAINNLSDPRRWFLFLFLFQVVALFLYLYDLKLIKKHQKKFSLTTKGKRLYRHILSEQRKELRLFIPSSLVFNLIAIISFHQWPDIFLKQQYHLVFIFLQLIVALLFLRQEMKSFRKRSELLQ